MFNLKIFNAQSSRTRGSEGCVFGVVKDYSIDLLLFRKNNNKIMKKIAEKAVCRSVFLTILGFTFKDFREARKYRYRSIVKNIRLISSF